MNQLTRAVMDQIFTGYKTMYNQGLATVKTQYLRYAQIVPSNSPIEQYPMMFLTGGMRKWIGSRVINRMTGRKMTIVNDDYEFTYGIPALDLMYDKIGIYNGHFTDAGIIAGNLWDKLANAVLLDNPTWADGKAFFASDRTIDDKEQVVINNLVSAAFSYTAYSTARLQMMSFTDINGEPLELKPDMLQVGPKHEMTAKAMLNNETIIVGGVAVTNPYRDASVELQVCGRFIGDYEDDFRLMCTSRGLKPVIVQKVLETGLIRKDSQTDDNMFFDKEAVYGCHSVGAAGPGLPQLIVAGIPTTGAAKKAATRAASSGKKDSNNDVVGTEGDAAVTGKDSGKKK